MKVIEEVRVEGPQKIFLFVILQVCDFQFMLSTTGPLYIQVHVEPTICVRYCMMFKEMDSNGSKIMFQTLCQAHCVFCNRPICIYSDNQQQRSANYRYHWKREGNKNLT
jgi:hypothetical protein